MANDAKNAAMDALHALMDEMGIPPEKRDSGDKGNSAAVNELEKALLGTTLEMGSQWDDEGASGEAVVSRILTAASLYAGSMLAMAVHHLESEEREKKFERAWKVYQATIPHAAKMYLESQEKGHAPEQKH